MIVIDGKEYRNLEEQVLKNMEDIEALKESGTDITTQDNTFTGTNTFNGSTTFNGNLYRPNTNGGGQLIVNNVMAGVSYSDDGDQTGQVAVTSAGTSITGLVSPVNDNDAANKQYVDNAISDIDLSGYVQKTTQANKLYGTDGSGNDKTYAISRNPVDFTNDGIVQRGKDGNVYVPKSPLDDYSATSKYYVNNTKVAKVTTSNIVYGRGTGIEKAYNVGTAATANNIVQRKADGQITVPTTPSADTDATSKKYVDDQIATIDTSSYVSKSTNPNIVYGTNPDGTPKLWGVGNIAANYLINRTTNGNVLLPAVSAITNNNYAASKAYVDSVASAAGSTYTVQVESNYTQGTVTYGWKIGKMIIFYGTLNDGINTNGNSVTVASGDTISHGYIKCGAQTMPIEATTGRFNLEAGSLPYERNFSGVIWLS